MDGVIKQAVREELRRHLIDPNPPTATSSSNDHNNSTDPTLGLIMEDKDAC